MDNEKIKVKDGIGEAKTEFLAKCEKFLVELSKADIPYGSEDKAILMLAFDQVKGADQSQIVCAAMGGKGAMESLATELVNHPTLGALLVVTVLSKIKAERFPEMGNN